MSTLELPPPAPAPMTVPAARLRLVYLHLASRRVPMALASMVALALVLVVALRWHWGTNPEQLPVIIEGAATVIIAYTLRSPFGESEQATGQWLPYLRLAVVLLLEGAAIGALAAGAAAEQLPDGTFAMARNVLGMSGIGLLSAVVVGGTMAWVGTLVYLALVEYALSVGWTTPWTWPARPPHELGAALCAGAMVLAGIVIITVRGAADRGQE